MNKEKYRKWYLTENWQDNRFIMIKEKVNISHYIFVSATPPKILSGEAFWITYNELCVGYYSEKNPDIFRPIFSHKRQRLLDKVHHGNIEDDEGDKYSINNPHLGYARKKYLVAFNEYVIIYKKKYLWIALKLFYRLFIHTCTYILIGNFIGNFVDNFVGNSIGNSVLFIFFNKVFILYMFKFSFTITHYNINSYIYVQT